MPEQNGQTSLTVSVSTMITIITTVIGISLGWTSLKAELAVVTAKLTSLEEWRQNVNTSRFTDKDAQALELRMERAVAQERAYARSMCAEVRRLTTELGKTPTNDCGRP